MKNSTFHIVPGVAEITLDVSIAFRCPPHFHENYAVGIFHGCAATYCRGRSWPVERGAIVVHHPREVHWGDAVGICAQDFFYVAPDLLRSLFGSVEPVVFPVPVIADAGLRDVLIEGLHAAASGQAGRLQAGIARLFVEHGVAVSGGLSPSLLGSLVADGSDALHVPVAGLSAAAGLSRSHFSRTFSRMIGLSPRDFKRQARVQAAHDLIAAGTTLAQSASDAGFADQAHMTRQFRSILGITPNAIRRAAKR